MNEGESIPFTGFDGAAGTLGCCGDDTGEFYLETNLNSYACCDTVTDFAHSQNQCESQANLRFIYGYIEGELENGTIVPLNNSLIRMIWATGDPVNEIYTDEYGWYNISIPNNNDYILSVYSPMHDSPAIPLTITDHLYLNLSLTFSSNCEPDCTTPILGEYRCEADCNGFGGCAYDAGVTSDFYGGETMKALCDGALPGWNKEHNSTHEIICCNLGYSQIMTSQSADVDFDTDVKDAQTFYAGAVNYEPNGELYGVYVIVYSTE